MRRPCRPGCCRLPQVTARMLVLHARSRGAGGALICLVGTAVALAALEPWLVAQPRYGEMVRLPLSFFGAMSAAIALSGTLYSPMHQMEASAPQPWRAWRATHGVLALTVAAAIMGPALPTAAWGAHCLLRGLTGLFGLALIAAVILGPRLAWSLPCVYGAAAYLTGGVSSTGARAVWGFLTQPTTSMASDVTAASLFSLGLLAWSRRD